MKKVIDEKYGLVYVDENNNMWDADLYSEEEAKELSETLVDCKNCFNSKNLIECENCVECSFCNDCEDCEYCSYCDVCVACVDCHNSAFLCSKMFVHYKRLV